MSVFVAFGQNYLDPLPDVAVVVGGRSEPRRFGNGRFVRDCSGGVGRVAAFAVAGAVVSTAGVAGCRCCCLSVRLLAPASACPKNLKGGVKNALFAFWEGLLLLFFFRNIGERGAKYYFP